MKRIGLICIALLVALSTMGAGYAYWTQNLEVSTYVQMGRLEWIWTGFGNWDMGSDYNALPGNIDNPYVIDLDVGATVGRVRAADNHYIDVTMTNIYPGYYTQYSTNFRNMGTMPIKIRDVTLIYDREYILPFQEVVTTDDGVFQFRWLGTTAGDVVPPQPPSRTWTANIEVFTVNPVFSTPQQQQRYFFSIHLNGEQTNAAPLP